MSSIVSGISRKTLSVFSYVFLAVFFAAVVYVGLDPSQHKFKLYEAPIPIFVAAAALLISLAWLVDQKTNVRSKLARFYWPLIVVAFAGTIAVQVVVAHALRSYGYTWDTNIVFQQSANYAVNGSIDPALISYFAINPNNIPLLVVFGSLFKALRSFGIYDFLTAAIALNVVILTLTQIVTFLTVKLLYGRAIAAVSMIFSFVLISLTMYVQIPYTDTLAILFPILMLYITIHAARTNRVWLKILLSILLGVVAMTGYLVKPTVIIGLIAIIIVAIFGYFADWQSKNWKKSAAVALMCLVGGAAALLLTHHAYVVVADRLYIVPFSVTKTQDTSKPLFHFAAMGLKTVKEERTVTYGGYNEADAYKMTTLQGRQAKTDYSINLIKQRLSAYGPVGYSQFLAHKTNWILSDATFYAYGEGSNEAVKFTSQDPVSKHIRGFMYVDGKRYILFGNILQVFWVGLLLLIAVQIIIQVMDRGAKISAYTIMPRLMITGILVFLLLFEGRSRYIFLYLPIFIVTAMYTLQWFRSSKGIANDPK